MKHELDESECFFLISAMVVMQSTLLGNQHGQSVIQVLISIGLMGIIMMTFVSMMTSQTRETQAISQKLASTDLEKILQTSLADGSVCEYIVNNPTVLTFDSTQVSPTTPQVITPTLPIYASVKTGPPIVTGPVVAQIDQPVSPYSSSAVVKTIALSISGAPAPLPAPGPGVTFTGNWLVTFEPTKLVRALVPVSVTTTLTVDTTTPTAAKITGCNGAVSGGTGGSICGMRQVLCSNGGTLEYDQCYCGPPIVGQSIPCQGAALQITAAGPGACVPIGGGSMAPNASNITCPSGYSGGYVWSGWGPPNWGVFHIFCVHN